MSLRLRLSIGYALLFTVGLLLIGGTLYQFLARTLLDDVDDELRERADALQRAAVIRGGADGLDAARLSADIFVLAPASPGQELAAPGIYARVLDTSGNVLAVSSGVAAQLPIDHEKVMAAASGSAQIQTVEVEGARVRVLYTPLRFGSQISAVIQVGESVRPIEHTLARAQAILIIGGACAVAGGIVGGWWITRRSLLPVVELTEAVARIAATGEFTQRVPQPDTADEIERLASTFNELLDRLGIMVDRQRALVADTSHELRNPLMVARGNLELLAHDNLPPDERREAVADSLEEVDRMTRLVSDLLFLADADTSSAIHHTAIELNGLVASVAEDARLIASREDGEREVVLAQNDPIVVQGDELRLRQLLWNLVENAIRYTPAGGTITIALRRQGPVAELTVTDTGIGIAPEHLPHLFERFYRVDKGRSRAVGGTGLGLSIVRQVAETHGGQVRVRSEPGKGSTFTVALPIRE